MKYSQAHININNAINSCYKNILNDTDYISWNYASDSIKNVVNLNVNINIYGNVIRYAFITVKNALMTQLQLEDAWKLL